MFTVQRNLVNTFLLVMHGALVIIAALFAVLAGATRHSQIVLPLYSDTFVYLHVGLPGTLVPFWVRWDVDYIAVLPEAQLRSFSRSWASDSTDMVCFGTDCVRLPIAIDFLPPAPDPTHIVPDGTRQYRGILGLGDNSAVWSVFPFWRFSERSLVLMREHHLPPRHSVHYPDSILPVRANGERFWARIDLSTDYSMVPWSLAQIRDKRWRLDVYESDAQHRYVKLRIAPWLYTDTAEDGSNVHTMRPGHEMDGLDAARKHNSNTTWNATDTLILGRRLVQSGFTVQRNTISGETWITCDWLYSPITSYLVYVSFFLVLLPLDLLWLYGVYDSADFASRVGQFAFPPPPPTARGYVLQVDGYAYSIPPGALSPPRLPPGVDTDAQPVSMLSYRHARFSTALIVLTQTAFAAVVLCMTLGFGFTDKFWHELFGPQDYAAVYSTVGVGVFYACALWSLSSFPTTTAMWGDHLALLTLWLLAAVEPFEPANSFVMLLTSGAVAVHSVQQFISFMLGRLWPWRTYRTNWWTWALALGFLAVWSSWLFSFYTVILVTLSWRADHPGVWAIGAVSFILVAFLAHRISNQRQLVRLALRTAAVEILIRDTKDMLDAIEAKRVA